MSWILEAAKSPSAAHLLRATQHQLQLTKPAGSLGRLESLAITLASLQENDKPKVEKIHIQLFASDHGIADENVSAFPQAVTAQMVENFSSGGAAISVLAKQLQAQLAVCNIGTVGIPHEMPGVTDRRIAAGTQNFALGPAMDKAQLDEALDIGRDTVNSTIDLWVGGEMGIANTTSATALGCALLHTQAKHLTGPGTGIDDTVLAHKIKVIDGALALHKAQKNSPLENLRCLGGFEIAALTGAYISAAQKGVPVLVDGFICTVAARYALTINPSIKPWLLLSHTSAEPGHRLLLEGFAHPPLLDLNMRLGEASGAASCIPLLKLACQLHNTMATFADAGVSNKET